MRVSVFILVGLLLIGIPTFSHENVKFDSTHEVSYHKLPNGILVMFMTRHAGLEAYKDAFHQFEVDNRTLLGLFMPPHSIWNGKKATTVIFVIVKDPSIYTTEYVNRLAKMFSYISSPKFQLDKVDMLTEKTESEYAEAGVFYHELCHLSDAIPMWYGKQRTMLHATFPQAAPDVKDEPLANPWQVLREFWPDACSHPGFDITDYSKGYHVR